MFKGDSSTVRAGGKVVGKVESRVFVKRVKASRHQLREPRAWAIDSQSLDDAESLGAETVQIVDLETDAVYSASIALIREKGFRLDRGHGEQVALLIKHWSVYRPGEAQQLAFALT